MSLSNTWTKCVLLLLYNSEGSVMHVVVVKVYL
jgi:hypothetical protein